MTGCVSHHHTIKYCVRASAWAISSAIRHGEREGPFWEMRGRWATAGLFDMVGSDW